MGVFIDLLFAGFSALVATALAAVLLWAWRLVRRPRGPKSSGILIAGLPGLPVLDVHTIAIVVLLALGALALVAGTFLVPRSEK
jgi:hypothetical protein